MKNINETIDELIKVGENFTYENFCTSLSRYGYPVSYLEEWLTWTSRVSTFLKAKFGEKSEPFILCRKGRGIVLLGNDESNFNNAKAMLLSSLKSAKASISDDALSELDTSNVNDRIISNKVFVVHGHDEKAKQQLEIFLNELGLEPVVLHRQADEGQTIIEKFEKHSDVGFAFILMTPDEVAYLSKDEDISDKKTEYRARPNVIFEFGYFVGKLGRSRVCCLHTCGVSLPSDLSGLIYKPFTNSIEESGYPIIKELKAAGYNV